MTASRIRVNTPEISVVLRKIARNQSQKSSRFQRDQEPFDLTPYLTEESSVSISRGINQPSGTFQITMSDRDVMHGRTRDSMYGIAEPMDVIEIRMARDAYEYNDASLYPELGDIKLPLVFRGLVSEVRRDESVGGDGKPRRVVSISGHDWGKFLQIMQCKFIKGNPLQQNWLANMIQIHFGIEYKIIKAGDLVTDLTKKFVNEALSRYNSPGIIVPFEVDVSGADPRDFVMPQGFGIFQGTLWEFYHVFGDLGPYYEMFIDDGEKFPKLIYRKPPYITAGGVSINPVSPVGKIVNVAPETVQRISVSRTDSNVANWFWVDHHRTALIQGFDQKMFAQADNAFNSFVDTPNSAKEIYGIKTMEVTSNHGFLSQGADAKTLQVDSIGFNTYVRQKIAQLQSANQDNVVFEQGSLTLAGNEKIKVGQMLSVARGRNINQYYAQSVTHSFLPFRSFTTSVNFIRGTGFINRSTNEANQVWAPYLEDIGRSPYEGE